MITFFSVQRVPGGNISIIVAVVFISDSFTCLDLTKAAAVFLPTHAVSVAVILCPQLMLCLGL